MTSFFRRSADIGFRLGFPQEPTPQAAMAEGSMPLYGGPIHWTYEVAIIVVVVTGCMMMHYWAKAKAKGMRAERRNRNKMD